MRDRQADRDPAVRARTSSTSAPKAPVERRVEQLVRLVLGAGVARFACGGSFSSKVPRYGTKYTDTNHEISSAAAVTAKIAKVYSPTVELRQADRQEADRGDQRAGQHRHRGRLVGEGRGAQLVVALLELAHHHLDRDDRVVDQQARAR